MKKKQDDEKYEEEVKNLTEILSKIGEDETPFEFEFFSGRKNEKFYDICRGLGLSSNNLEFLDFLQSDGCKKIFVSNKLKIHIETGNIYYDDNDTNESIFDFLLKQQDPTMAIINFDFIYGGNYVDYFNWLIESFTSYQKIN